MEEKDIVINEFNFTRLVELGRIAIHKAGIPKHIVEKMLIRIANENQIPFYFIENL